MASLSSIINFQEAQLVAAQLLAIVQRSPIGTLVIVLGLVLLAWRLLRLALGILGFIWAYFLRPGRNLKRYGSWAVVTGATDGIGKAYAAALAKQGLNVVLISRTESKLKEAAAEVEVKYKVQTRVVPADLTSPDEGTMARVASALEGLEVGILINNAGMSYDHPDYLDTIDSQAISDIIAINSLAPTQLAKLVLPGMKARKRGAIVNIGSGSASVVPTCPLLSVYAGTKAYIDLFSTSMAEEYRSFGISVQNQAPMFVATKLSKIRRARLDAPSPEAWVAAALKQIGYEPSATPFWFHGLQRALIRSVPAWVVNRQVMQLHQGFRTAFYRRQARREAEEAAAAAAAVTEAPDSPTRRELRRRK